VREIIYSSRVRTCISFSCSSHNLQLSIVRFASCDVTETTSRVPFIAIPRPKSYDSCSDVLMLIGQSMHGRTYRWSGDDLWELDEVEKRRPDRRCRGAEQKGNACGIYYRALLQGRNTIVVVLYAFRILRPSTRILHRSLPCTHGTLYCQKPFSFLSKVRHRHYFYRGFVLGIYFQGSRISSPDRLTSRSKVVLSLLLASRRS
jgi:hypothetical protein